MKCLIPFMPSELMLFSSLYWKVLQIDKSIVDVLPGHHTSGEKLKLLTNELSSFYIIQIFQSPLFLNALN